MNTKINILVIGGLGFYGKRVVHLLKKSSDFDVKTASRSGGLPHIKFDLCNEDLYPLLLDFDLVVNASDPIAAPPDQLLTYCVENGVDYFDMGADSETAQRLININVINPKGCAVIGVGIFPGLSTLFAHDIYQKKPEIQSIELGIRVSPLSGSGLGNCNLMTEMLTIPSHQIKDHQTIYGPPVGSMARLRFKESGVKIGNQVALPDTQLIYRSTTVPNIVTYLSIFPGFLRYNFSFLSSMLKWAGILKPFCLWGIRSSLWLLRAIFLKNVSSSVSLTIVADKGLDTEKSTMIKVTDGHLGTAIGVVSSISLWAEKDKKTAGVYTVSELFELDPFLKRWEELSGEKLI